MIFELFNIADFSHASLSELVNDSSKPMYYKHVQRLIYILMLNTFLAGLEDDLVIMIIVLVIERKR